MVVKRRQGVVGEVRVLAQAFAARGQTAVVAGEGGGGLVEDGGCGGGSRRLEDVRVGACVGVQLWR